MKWLKKLLGFDTTPPAAPADAGAKAFDQMAKTLSAPEEKVIGIVAQEVKDVLPEAVAVAPVVAPEVQAVAAKVEEVVKPKAPRKPRAKKEPVVPLPQTVSQNVGEWPFPGNPPAEGEKKPKPAARKVKAK